MIDDSFYIKAYVKYRKEIKNINFLVNPISYKRFILPTQISGEWVVYCEMLENFSRQLVDDINQLRRYIIKLEAWSKVLFHYENEEEKIYLLLEFIEPLAIIALNLPYAIKNRFIFSLSHICHQANRIKFPNWRDDLPEDQFINLKTMDEKCKVWENYNNFKLHFLYIANDKFNKETSKFRHKFHHRIPVSVEFGLTGFIYREKYREKKQKKYRKKKQNSRVTYIIGETQPIPLNKLVNILKDQYIKIIECFKEYQNLVNEQLNEIFGT